MATNIEELIREGLESFYQEDLDRAEEIFRKAIEIEEENMAGNFYLGHILQLKRNLKEAKEKFDLVIKKAEEILKEDENNVDANYFLGAAIGGKAIQEFNPLVLISLQRKFFSQMEKVILLNPLHFEAYWLKGRALGIMGRFEEAIECLNKSLEIKQIGDIYVDLGLIYVHLRDFQNAEKCFYKALELKPESPTVYYNLGFLYQAKGDKEKAREFKEKSEELLNRKKRGAL
jgi:tetratricopeptide (TPR) repeat protein